MRKSPTENHPDHIGPYRLLRVLGEGGMGIVYEAEQRVTVRRKVAVKVMKPGLDTKEVMARFEAERQALAVMEHPGIAKVLDAGATDEGRPYFVMELVHGRPLRDYADARKLSIRERLELFVRVCHAVQHAHHKGVIHRDLKPSNILVEEREGTATPRVIDFGIAKATGQRLSEVTLVTQLGQALGTPAYMSPEQAEASGLDVDMRTDVYSLGVTLYELLVGRLPIDPAEVGPQGFMYQLLLRESEPPTPSHRYRTLEGTYRDAVAGFRRTDPGTLRKELAGDLDCIVMKALEKDRDQRYDTVNALALDIQRHLRHEPVWASSPNLAYRVRKFVRRHRVGVVAGAAIALALVGGSLLATAGMIRAQNAERNAADEATAAREVADFLVKLFSASDPGEARGDTITARELLAKGSERIRTELVDQPITQARLMHTIGKVYLNLGNYDSAAAMLERAVAIRQEALGTDHLDLAESLHVLAGVDYYAAEYARADSLYRRALTIRERSLGLDHPDVASTLSDLGALNYQQGRYPEAEAFLRRAVAIYEAAPDRDDSQLAIAYNNLAGLLASQGTFDEAEPLFRQALAIHESTLGPDHFEVATDLGNLSFVTWKQGKYEDAASLQLRALAIREKVLGPDHADVGVSLHVLANVRADQGRYAEAESLYVRSRGILEAALTPMHPQVAVSVHYQAILSGKQGRDAEAEALHLRALSIWEETVGLEHPYAVEGFVHLASMYVEQGRYTEAESLAVTLEELAAARREAGRGDDADSLAARAQSIRGAVVSQ